MTAGVLPGTVPSLSYNYVTLPVVPRISGLEPTAPITIEQKLDNLLLLFEEHKHSVANDTLELKNDVLLLKREVEGVKQRQESLSTQPIIFGSENRLNEILTCIKSVKCLNQWYLSTRLISA